MKKMSAQHYYGKKGEKCDSNATLCAFLGLKMKLRTNRGRNTVYWISSLLGLFNYIMRSGARLLLSGKELI